MNLEPTTKARHALKSVLYVQLNFWMPYLIQLFERDWRFEPLLMYPTQPAPPLAVIHDINTTSKLDFTCI
jgi:hypothetical protein